MLRASVRVLWRVSWNARWFEAFEMAPRQVRHGPKKRSWSDSWACGPIQSLNHSGHQIQAVLNPRAGRGLVLIALIGFGDHVRAQALRDIDAV